VFILAGGFDTASAQKALAEGQADLVAFGRPFLANPDLVARMQKERAAEPGRYVDVLYARVQRLYRLPDTVFVTGRIKIPEL
jgi:2,4-dienoyl-CoA reductase-like NADH-dependent reductase (Old Yellow Enzyme family)